MNRPEDVLDAKVKKVDNTGSTCHVCQFTSYELRDSFIAGEKAGANQGDGQVPKGFQTLLAL